jgi:hypothetical protein
MKQLKPYLNKLVNITVQNKMGLTSNLSGNIGNIGKSYILFTDQDGNERPFRKDAVIDVKLINKAK